MPSPFQIKDAGQVIIIITDSALVREELIPVPGPRGTKRQLFISHKNTHMRILVSWQDCKFYSSECGSVLIPAGALAPSPEPAQREDQINICQMDEQMTL